MASRRQIQEVVAEKTRAETVQLKLDQQGLGRGTVAHDKISEGKNGIMQSPIKKTRQKIRNTIGHKEFFQVFLNFNLYRHCIKFYFSKLV